MTKDRSPLEGFNRHDRDWPQDYDHEDGNYWSTCAYCKMGFTGHKDRLYCQECYTNHNPKED